MTQTSHDTFAAFIGIDWADAKHDGCLQAAGTAKRECFQLEHTPEAIDAWVTTLVVYLQPAGNSNRPPIRYNAPFTTGVRGLCHGIEPRCLPARADRSGVVVSHALVGVAIGARSRSTDTTHASDATTQTLHSTQTLDGSRPQAPLRRL